MLSQDWRHGESKLSSSLGNERYRQQSSICNGPEVGMYLACLRIARIRGREEKGSSKTSVREQHRPGEPAVSGAPLGT